jgi:hypothetical protein
VKKYVAWFEKPFWAALPILTSLSLAVDPTSVLRLCQMSVPWSLIHAKYFPRLTIRVRQKVRRGTKSLILLDLSSSESAVFAFASALLRACG